MIRWWTMPFISSRDTKIPAWAILALARHEGENRGGWDTVIMDADYNSMFALQQALIEVPIPSADDLPEKPFLDFAEAVRDMDQPKK